MKFKIYVSVICSLSQIFQKKCTMLVLNFQMSVFSRKCHIFSRNMELNNSIMNLQWTSGYEFDLPVVHSSCLWRVPVAWRNWRVMWARLETHRDSGVYLWGYSCIPNIKYWNLREISKIGLNVLLSCTDVISFHQLFFCRKRIIKKVVTVRLLFKLWHFFI